MGKSVEEGLLVALERRKLLLFIDEIRSYDKIYLSHIFWPSCNYFDQ